MLVAGHCQIEVVTEPFKRVAEHAMADIMQEGSRYRHMRLALIRIGTALAYGANELAGDVEHANAMRKPCMRRTRKNQFGKAELLDATEPLEWARLNNAPQFQFELLLGTIGRDPELDQVMNRATDPLWLRSRHQVPPNPRID